MSREIVHVPVLCQEVLDHLPDRASLRALDLTLGLGGHAEAILAKLPQDARYLGVDRDAAARETASKRLAGDDRFTILASTYEDLWETEAFEVYQKKEAPQGFDFILADLGISTLQLKDAERGFSFMNEGPLDMRMNPDSGLSALEWLEEQTETTLADALYQFGEERASRPISRSILRAFNEGQLKTTLDLAKAVYKVLPQEIARRKKQSDPATRTFQAIRIAVNGELVRLAESLERAVFALAPEGRLAVISFHSLEDRIVKQTFKRLAGFYDGPGRQAPQPLPVHVRLLTPKGLAPTEEECACNPPSRSARLRVVERLKIGVAQ